MTEMKCCKLLKYYILYYNCGRRSRDESTMSVSSMYGDNKVWPTLDTKKKYWSVYKISNAII